MAINIPSEYEPVDPALILGRAPFDDQPLDSMLDLTNWLYANHSPPIVAAAPSAFTDTGSQNLVFPLWASADSLDYECLVRITRSVAATVTVDFFESATDSVSPFGAATSTTTTASGATDIWHKFTLSAVAGTTRFAKLTATWSAGVGSITGLIIYPKLITSITSAIKPSGFWPYEAAHLTSTGAAIHTEYINRAYRNVAAVYRDRRVCLASLIYDTTRSVSWTKWSGNLTSLPGGCAQTWIGGQAGATVTVRARGIGSGGSTISVHEYGQNVAETILLDGADNSATFTIKTDRPRLVWSINLAPATNLVNMNYIVIEWRPGD